MTVKTPPINTNALLPTLREEHARQGGLSCAFVDPDMRHWLGLAARRLRDDAKLIRSEVAGPCHCSESSLRGLEIGESLPRDLGHVLNVYAELGGLTSGRDVWRLALQMWDEADEGGSDLALPLADDDPKPESPQSDSVGKANAAKRKRAGGGGRR